MYILEVLQSGPPRLAPYHLGEVIKMYRRFFVRLIKRMVLLFSEVIKKHIEVRLLKSTECVS